MKSLTCVVIGDGSVVVVEIDEHKKVATLKKKIKEEKMYKFPADQLTLYVAKKGGNWLKSDDPGVLQLKEGVVATAIRDIMKNEMNTTYRVHNKAFGFPDEDEDEDEDAADGEIHVLVGLPEHVKTGLRYDRKTRKMAFWYGIAGLLFMELALCYVFISGECIIIKKGRLKK
ncbi:hypothetical protein PR001_g26700 [Phytophthora rubi]|uniref:Crinkler effector protein N-terminal domain-containing protein n=1 Tax=Phytophthora rubi TaxID=129364 RepID=A0A6A3HTT4_9STRA|nr:hypothetical protein PR001_g26700 [Phytophthora rubi]